MVYQLNNRWDSWEAQHHEKNNDNNYRFHTFYGELCNRPLTPRGTASSTRINLFYYQKYGDG